MRLSKTFLIFLLAAIVLRILVAFWSLQFRENTDVLRYKDWTRIAYLHGFADTYTSSHLTFGTLPNNQPPGSLYTLSIAYNIELQTAKLISKLTNTPPGNNQWVNGPLVTLFLRLPSIIADIIIGILLYLFIKKRGKEKGALIGSNIFLFAPSVWYNSAFWGQMDSLNNLMFLTAIFFFYEAKYLRTMIFTFLSVLIKLSLLPLLPLFFYALYLKKKTTFKNLIPTLIISLMSAFLFMLPVAGLNPFWIVEFISKNSLGEMQQITNFAFNFWWFVFHPSIISGNPTSLFSFSDVHLIHAPIGTSSYLFLPLQSWAFIIFIVLTIPLLKKIISLKDELLVAKNLFLLLTLVSVLIFLFLPRMHERYLYPFFPILAIVVGLSGKYLKTFLVLSFLNMINLYIVWHPMKLWFFPYELINNSSFQWLVSAGIVITGLLFYYQTLRFDFKHEKRK
jgi:Gpi18-like mannosyltransferase